MNEAERKKLQGILRKIDMLRMEVEDLIGANESTAKRKAESSQDVKELMKSIDSLSSGELKNRLETLGHKELGEMFTSVGGSSGDKRKPKAWLVERILWLAKEFAEGHKTIRES